MSTFQIHGGKQLQGTITPQGSKNEALAVLCATLLTSSPVTLYNVPEIRDVHSVIALLQLLGVKVTQLQKNVYQCQADCLQASSLTSPAWGKHFSETRGSIMVISPLLLRLGQVNVPQPGGDRIGRRHLDTHYSALCQLGATVAYDPKTATYAVEAKTLQGTSILLEEASVTGTATCIMAACLTKGKTTIYHAACEPHIQQLCTMLVQMGARIEGIGTNLITIQGVTTLQGTVHTLAPDMIEVGSFIGLAATTQSELTIDNVYTPHLGLIPTVFQKLGIQLAIEENRIHIPAQPLYCIQKNRTGALPTLYDAVWPGFPADLISIAIVVATQAQGTILIQQRMYESRLFFVDRLIEMGAMLVLCDPHRVCITGLQRTHPLRGIRMVSSDIRAGIALLIAALSAEGTSIIDNIQQIDRGYEQIDQRLRALGAAIVRLGS